MTASIVVVCVLIPGWATAQNPLPIKVPETAIEPVDQIIQTVQQQVGSPALGVVDPGAGSGTGEPQTIEPAPAQPVDRPPADRPPADPAPQAGPTQEIPAGGVGSAPSPATSQGSGSASAGHGNGGEAQGGGEPKSDDPAAGQGNGDEAQGGGEPKSDDPAVDAEAGARTEIGRASTQSGWTLLNVVERLVGVVPMPLKIALGMLAALLVLAITGAWRVRRRLALAERRAATDGLTGLPNRRHADEVIERLLAASRRKERPLAVMLFDLDHFKAINDRFGHAIGDDALRATADATRRLLRGSDHFARFGGEEFLVLLPETGADAALIVAEKLRSRIAELDVAGLDGGMTASFGVAVYPDHGIGADELIEAADLALYRAKETGRNRVETSAEPLLASAKMSALTRGTNPTLVGTGNAWRDPRPRAHPRRQQRGGFVVDLGARLDDAVAE